ncbi:MAG: DUF1565 domain-containing protein [Gomphosphaeria aponina SAG 52.96 = DSM 107014]|uniref:DUF1565 domain-containing protein n=1 Tax=Gomphosphaeria aponina SAG 52.96 = DSM 107014 TaxID=1521640 RepID=A0A941GUV6_9CHRO|nr:DUF1565 domain-containing protein [Gomphosphaeria aponina SAG 52.96 = DSM 107014]
MSRNSRVKFNLARLILGGIAIIIPLNLMPLADAQTIKLDYKQNREQAIVLHVNSAQGDDGQGKGTESLPLKTITHALKIAQPKTVIMLAPGIYSVETGEEFPLYLQTEVTIQGSPASLGHNIIIQGGGLFVIGPVKSQNVTIAALERARGITGITVINPDPRGYGLWIESANPHITHNTFTRNGSIGVAVNGKGAPTIAHNYFYNNGGNGLVIYGHAQPQVTDNEFENTGFGISVMENAAPLFRGNKLKGNKIGIILAGNAQAILRNNMIENSTENGLVAIAQSVVDLGRVNTPGGNTFRGNRLLDIKNSSENPINAFGNDLTGNTEGNINITKLASASTQSPSPRAPQFPSEKSDISIEVNAPASMSPLTNNPTEESEGIEIFVPPPETSSSIMYRVLVATKTNQDAEMIRLLFPDAFSTVYHGHSMLQVGLFSTEERATEALEDLKLNGFIGIIVNN